MTTWIERLTHDAEGLRALQQEIAVQQFGDLVCELMNEQNVSRLELADKLECPVKFLSACVDGETTVELELMSAILTELGHGLVIKSEPIQSR